jgi:tetrahydromethanopterin S-methyltransferase subunit G
VTTEKWLTTKGNQFTVVGEFVETSTGNIRFVVNEGTLERIEETGKVSKARAIGITRTVVIGLLVTFVTVNLFNATLLAIGMWFINVPWRNWYIFISFALDAMWISIYLIFASINESAFKPIDGTHAAKPEASR